MHSRNFSLVVIWVSWVIRRRCSTGDTKLDECWRDRPTPSSSFPTGGVVGIDSAWSMLLCRSQCVVFRENMQLNSGRARTSRNVEINLITGYRSEKENNNYYYRRNVLFIFLGTILVSGCVDMGRLPCIFIRAWMLFFTCVTPPWLFFGFPILFLSPLVFSPAILLPAPTWIPDTFAPILAPLVIAPILGVVTI